MNTKTNILIVGAGPTGLTASLLLSRFSIPHILIDKRGGPNAAPAAHVINRRTMEIFRQIGLPMDEIYALDQHKDDSLSVRWAANLVSPALAELNVTDFADEGSDLSRERLANISQYRLEALLLREVLRSETATVLLEHEWRCFSDNSKRQSEVLTVDGSRVMIEADYVLAADGAGSPIRKWLKIDQSGPKNLATFLALSVRAKSPKGVLLNWCIEPRFSGVTITHHPTDLTVYMRQLHEPWESEADFDDRVCKDLISKLFVGQEPELLRKDVWRMTAQVADRFRSGRVFLVGDAAHRFPPTGGLGLNSGVADAHNLVWKIAARLQGADDELLGSYEQERRSVVQKNCDESLRNFRKMDEVIRAIGLDPEKASLPARILATAPFRFLPRAMRESLLAALTYPVKRQLDRCAYDKEARAVIQAAADNQRDHFDMPHLELGYRYGASIATALDENRSDITSPGMRLPCISLSGEKVSSIHDLLCCQAYTLLSAGEPNIDQFESFSLPTNRVDTKSIVGRDGQLDELLGLETGNWILVRPDGHIAAYG